MIQATEYVTIGPYKVPIVYGELRCPDGTIDLGRYHNTPTPFIEIHRHLTGLNLPMTKLHECIEFIDNMYHMELAEWKVCVLEVTIGSLIRDNRQLVADLQT